MYIYIHIYICNTVFIESYVFLLWDFNQGDLTDGETLDIVETILWIRTLQYSNSLPMTSQAGEAVDFTTARMECTT